MLAIFKQPSGNQCEAWGVRIIGDCVRLFVRLRDRPHEYGQAGFELVLDGVGYGLAIEDARDDAGLCKIVGRMT